MTWVFWLVLILAALTAISYLMIGPGLLSALMWLLAAVFWCHQATKRW